MPMPHKIQGEKHTEESASNIITIQRALSTDDNLINLSMFFRIDCLYSITSTVCRTRPPLHSLGTNILYSGNLDPKSGEHPSS